MAFSSYQVEWLIRRLRRWIAGPFPGRGHASDPVRTTPGERRVGAADDPFSIQRARKARPGGLKAIAEARRYGAVVEAERERRAGIFMDPPYPEAPGISGTQGIPKLKRDVRRDEGRGSLGDAD